MAPPHNALCRNEDWRFAEMTRKAVGTFEVKLGPQKPDDGPVEGARWGRMSIKVEGGKHSYAFEYSLVGEG